jgi:hypothetical protein
MQILNEFGILTVYVHFKTVHRGHRRWKHNASETFRAFTNNTGLKKFFLCQHKADDLCS